MAERFVDAYRRYCWTVETLDDPKVAPFQILAGEVASTPIGITRGTWRRSSAWPTPAVASSTRRDDCE
jgi:PNKP adenylyltransferase domain, ligase domain